MRSPLPSVSPVALTVQLDMSQGNAALLAQLLCTGEAPVELVVAEDGRLYADRVEHLGHLSALGDHRHERRAEAIAREEDERRHAAVGSVCLDCGCKACGRAVRHVVHIVEVYNEEAARVN